MLSKTCEATLRRALAVARAEGAPKATCEHLLLALTKDPDGKAALRGCGADVERPRVRLALQADAEPSAEPTKEMAVEVMNVVQRAAGRARELGQEEITGADLLLALSAEQGSGAFHVLRGQGINAGSLSR